MSERALRVGDRAPAFALQTTGGETVKLSDFRGKRVVLYFYPKDDTPGCTKEACGFRDAGQQLASRNTVVLGVSRDTPVSHQRFADKFRLPFPLLSDPDAAVCKAYGAYKQKSLYGRSFLGIERSTFIIDEEGRIAAVFPKVRVEGHVDEVLQALSGAAQRPAAAPAR